MSAGPTHRLTAPERKWLTALVEAVPISEVITGSGYAGYSDVSAWAAVAGVACLKVGTPDVRAGVKAHPWVLRNQRMLERAEAVVIVSDNTYTRHLKYNAYHRHLPVRDYSLLALPTFRLASSDELDRMEREAKDPPAPFKRAGGDVPCRICGRKYIYHPFLRMTPCLNVLCDGTLVKL